MVLTITLVLVHILFLILNFSSELQYLNLSEVNLSEVAAPLLQCAVTQCESLGLARTRLTPHHLESLLASCETGRCPCTLPSPPHSPASLNISNNDLATIDPLSLAQVVTRLLRVNLGKTTNSCSQN